MRLLIVVVLISLFNIVKAQITLPSYQGVLAFKTVVATPAVTTTLGYAITSTGITSGGEVTVEGASPVTSKGVCWSTGSGPTAALSTKTGDGTGTGAFNSSVTGLNPRTLYYVRAYATNSAGTSYGEEFSFTTGSLVKGDLYQGGIVVYLLVNGDAGYDQNVPHGVIAATTDQSTGITWGSASSSSTSQAAFSGLANTQAIIAETGTEANAAKLCYDLVLNGYSDWYLPSREDIFNIYFASRYFPTPFVAGRYYWSSSGNNNINNTNKAYAFDQGGGQDGSLLKSTLAYVRAIRSF